MATLPDNKNIIKSETINMDITKNNTSQIPSKNPQLGEIAIEASQIVSRLEQLTEGVNLGDPAFNQSTVFLGFESKSGNDIIQALQGLILTDEDGEFSSLPLLDDVSKLVVMTHSLTAYCGNMDRHMLQKLSTRFTTDTTRWLSQIFGFLNASAFYHDDQLEGLVRVTRMMMHYKYPRYLEDGALAYVNNPPTIYSSVASPLGVVQHLCRQLGLPLSCVRPVPVNTHFGSQYTMDTAAMQKMLAEDVNAGRTPLIVIADAGTPITGHLDNISRIQELCRLNDVWLHLRGHSLAALALPPHQHNGHQPAIADSFTLPLGVWLGIPGLPMVTMYRQWDSSRHAPKSPLMANGVGPTPSGATPPVGVTVARQVGATRESTLPLVAGLTNDHQGRRVLALPLWAALLALGRDGVHARIRDNFLASERLWAAIDCYRHVRVLSQKPGGESGAYTVSELISKPTTTSLLLETTACSVVFQFTPELKEEEVLAKVPPYYDKINTWLGQILQLEAPQLPIDICEIENIGVVLRYCPFENVGGQQVSLEDIQTFVQCLEQQLIILRTTLQFKEKFVKAVEESPVLKIVDLPDWAGLGGVRYAPEGWEALLTDQAREELNQLNAALVDALRPTDSAFSLGEDAEGMLCVRFGMLTPQSDVDELIGLVVRVGQSVEENSRVLDSMSEIVKRGIETATLDLQKENEERLWQEGILRQVPVVGTFVNWWSPKTKETGVRGRSLNLTQGVVESTENIYKYHMQIQSNKGICREGGASVGGTEGGVGRGPPTPQVQTQVGSTHSRSSSHTSHASNQSTSAPSVGGHVNSIPNSNSVKSSPDVSVTHDSIKKPVDVVKPLQETVIPTVVNSAVNAS